MSDSYDVYVHEGHLVEVHRGEHGTVAQIFGEDWNTQPMVQFHAPALGPVVKQEPQFSLTPDFKTPIYRNYFLWAAVICGLLASFGLWLTLR
jgi:hypothetical protein